MENNKLRSLLTVLEVISGLLVLFLSTITLDTDPTASAILLATAVWLFFRKD